MSAQQSDTEDGQSVTLDAEAWAETTAHAVGPATFRFADPTAFRAHIDVMPFAGVRLSFMRYSALVSRRSPDLIRRSDPELLQLALMLSGRQGVEQNRNNVLISPGDMVLFDSSRPFEGCLGPREDGGSSVMLQFPRQLLPLPEPHIARVCAATLPGTQGVGRLLRQFLVGLSEEYRHCTPQDRLRLRNTTLDMVTALLAQYMDAKAPLSSESRSHLLFRTLSSFIVENLDDPDLSPDSIAQAHHISVRYLQRVFQEEGSTVTAFIKQHRLDRCRHDLADPDLAGIAISSIGSRWGFAHPSDFSRAFRAYMGMSPREYRHVTYAGSARP
ncbi:helix-turn-helix domain-containing protein [Streptomyces syringium]|uniref:AraC-like ligand-binding domain-containing protein n=1 Tax=Streptomyces syringium TaxID=76729 RepID=UPI00341DA223